MDYMIDIKNVSVRYPVKGGELTVLNDISFKTRSGRFVTVVGPSGCGKSTLLRLLLGSQFPTDGTVLVDGQQVKRVTRDCSIVFQNYSVFPHLTVIENIAFGLVLEKTGLAGRTLAKFLGIKTFANIMADTIGDTARDAALDAGATTTGGSPVVVDQEPLLSRALSKIRYFRIYREAREKAYELLSDVGLNRNDAKKYPFELSGGMRQRVAIAQAIAMKPKILLMDEPFGALDHRIREQMQNFIHEQWEKHNLTIFFVTHDLEEAIKLGTRLICLSQHWCDEEGKKGVGAKIVVDRKVLGGSLIPSQFVQSPEYHELLNAISPALSDKQLTPISQFDLSHEDAVRMQCQIFHSNSDMACAGDEVRPGGAS